MAYKKYLNYRFLFLFFAFLVILGFFILQLLFRNKQEKESLSQNQISALITPEASKLYKSSLYQIEYPKDWNYDVFNTISGDSIIFKPLNNPAENYYPSISVSITRDSKTPIETKEGVFLMYGFNKTEVLINNRIFTKLNGTYPYKIISGKSINVPVQETVLIYKEKNTEFLIKYQYEGSTINEELEKKFNEIITTFRFF